MSQQTVRIIKKRAYNEQFFFDNITTTTTELAASSIRVQAHSITISANNLSYCARGDAFHWFDVYPLPPDLPEPYNNAAEYAVAPGWGYFRVHQTTISDLPVGTMLYGMMPTSSMITDLKLKQTPDAPGHWTEISPHREKVWAMYSRYIVADADFSAHTNEYSRLWKVALGFASSYILNRYVFSSHSKDPAISPFPAMYSWTRADADLSKTVLITLGSGSKTCRLFVQQLATTRAQGTGPLALYEVTGCKEETRLSYDVSFHHKVVTYSEIVKSEVFGEVAHYGATRIVVLDFGGRGNTVEVLITQLRANLPNTNVTLINIGSGPAVSTSQDLQARQERASRLQALQMNATDMIDAIIAEIGEKQTYTRMEEAWQQVAKSQIDFYSGTAEEGKFLGMTLDVRHGVRGGLESAWEDICEGNATGNTACVVKF